MTQSESNVLVKTLVAKANEKKGTLQNFVVQAGIPVPTYRAWLKSESMPTEEEIKKLCDTLGCTVDEIKNAAKISSGKSEKTPKETKEPKEDFMPAPEEPTPVVEETEAPTEKPRKVEKKESTTKKGKTVSAKESVENKETPELPEKSAPTAEPEPVKEEPAKKTRKPRTPKEPAVTKTDIPAPKSPIEEFTLQVSVIEKMMEEAQTKFFSLVDNTVNNPPVDARYLELLETAKNASDDGIALAITILQKFPLA